MTPSPSLRRSPTSTHMLGRAWFCATRTLTTLPMRGHSSTRPQQRRCGCALQFRGMTARLRIETSAKEEIMPVDIDEALAALRRDGYFVTRVPVGGEESTRFVLEVGRSLGEIYVPKDCDPAEPVIRTTPTRARR